MTRTARAPRARSTAATPGGGALRDAVAALGAGALAVLRSPDFGRLVVAGLVCAGLGAASVRARARVLEQPGFSVESRDLARTQLPAFLSERAREDLASLDLPARVSAFEPGLCGVLDHQLRKVPWVDGVEGVRLDFDGTSPEGERLRPHVRFALRAARPIARIRERGQEALVARSRRRIPADRLAPGVAALPRIEGLPDESSVERESVLDEALALVQKLERRGLVGKAGIDSVTLTRDKGRTLEAALVLATGPRVDWGPVAEVPGLAVEERLKRLELFVEKGPPLATVERLSVRWDDPVYVLKPVAPEPVARSN